MAALGLLRDSEVIIIAAMVLAPLLGPNVALSLGTTLGDAGLSQKAIRANIHGILTALILAVAGDHGQD